MALQSTPNQAFLGNNDGAEDDLAALDSMSFTGSGAGGGGSGDNVGRIGDGRDAGFSGVSESLFDRIKARTAEQQKQAMSASSSSQQPSAFVSQQQQTSSEPTMEERDKQNSTVMGDVASSNTGSTMQQQQNNSNNEATYSLSASTGEDFSFQPAGPTANPPLRVPQYGASRDDPYYTAINNSNHQYPISIQDKASIALAQTGESVKSLWEAGVSGARAVGAMAQDKIAGGGSNNSFLLRGDGLVEEGSNMMGSGGGGGGASSTMSQPPLAAAVASGDATGAATSDQAYSMLAYFKTFCEDVFGFVMQLPPWGKGVVAVILLWVLYFLFG